MWLSEKEKDVLLFVCWSVKPHHLQLNYSKLMKTRRESYCSPEDSLLKQKVQPTECCVTVHIGSQTRVFLCRGKRQIEACLYYAGKHVANLSEVSLLERHLLYSLMQHCVKVLARSLWEAWQIPSTAGGLQWVPSSLDWIMNGNSTRQCEGTRLQGSKQVHRS